MRNQLHAHAGVENPLLMMICRLGSLLSSIQQTCESERVVQLACQRGMPHFLAAVAHHAGCAEIGVASPNHRGFALRGVCTAGDTPIADFNDESD